jgi:hypothetical protein
VKYLKQIKNAVGIFVVATMSYSCSSLEEPTPNNEDISLNPHELISVNGKVDPKVQNELGSRLGHW